MGSMLCRRPAPVSYNQQIHDSVEGLQHVRKTCADISHTIVIHTDAINKRLEPHAQVGDVSVCYPHVLVHILADQPPPTVEDVKTAIVDVCHVDDVYLTIVIVSDNCAYI